MVLYPLKSRGLVPDNTSQTSGHCTGPVDGAHSRTSPPRLPWEGKPLTSTLTGSQASRGAACRSGVRSLTGALGSPQNGTGLGDGALEALQEDRSEADRPRAPFVCACVCVRVCTQVRAHATCTGNSQLTSSPLHTRRKKKEIVLLVTETFLPGFTPISLASETIFRERTGSPVPCEVS